jgi:hypothetical protein
VASSRTQKPEQDDTPEVASSSTLKALGPSTVFEIRAWSIHCYGPTMATLLYILDLYLILNIL